MPQVQQEDPKRTAPAVQMEDTGVKTASKNERKRIAAQYGRNRTALGAGLMASNTTSGKQTLG